MTTLRTVRVAAVQATPVVLDAAGTVNKAVELIGDAASRGAELVVFTASQKPCTSRAGPDNRHVRASGLVERPQQMHCPVQVQARRLIDVSVAVPFRDARARAENVGGLPVDAGRLLGTRART